MESYITFTPSTYNHPYSLSHKKEETDTNNSSHHHHHWWKSSPKLHFTSTHIHSYNTLLMLLFFLHFTLLLDAKENRKTLKIDVVKRYVRDSSFPLFNVIFDVILLFLLVVYDRFYIAPKCNISCTVVGSESFCGCWVLSRW